MPDRPIILTARRMPPAGGLEQWTADIHRCLGAHYEVHPWVHEGIRATELAYLAMVATGLPTLCERLDARAVDGSDASLAPALARASKRLRPSVVRVHGLDLLHRNPAYQSLLRRALPRMDAVVANSRPTAALARSIGVSNDRLHVVHPQASTPGAPAPRPQGPLRVVMLGRLVARKGVLEFVRDVWPRIRAAEPDAHLDIVGDGPMRRRLMRALGLLAPGTTSTGVTWWGYLPRHEVEMRLREAHVMAMNNRHIRSDFEGFGIVAAEAAVRGVPVVARPVDGVGEAVLDGRTGRLVRDPDPGEMARAVLETSESMRDRRAIAMTARDAFGRDRHCKQYTRVMESVLP